ncbi:hypothetical protein [Algoriphagus winogradskyi]|uniref:Uncharacterized protein n=1 Tax=Algoriphagus winogradskyi TaxID=237017 RepID=A0ABY1P4C7_9BACT|nr:hypothetical protein [Algoriphagus winogradskyi]SMP24652.1 hypothetical protein SAMN06265367_10492 [Algoriphagus winogradskyi]
MKKQVSLLIILMVISQIAFSQINMEDSTVRTIAYWEIKETNSYHIALESFEIIDNDTSNWNEISYVVDMEILDSTESSYEVSWTYRDFVLNLGERDSAYQNLMEKLMTISEGSLVKFRTDEYGAFQEVTNWEDISEFYRKSGDTLKSMFGNIPQIDAMVDQTFTIYRTKNSIETQSIKDVLQFLNFHGAEYKLGEELSGILYSPNVLGKNRLETQVYVLLEEIFPEDNDYRIVSFSEANAEQLTSETRLVLKTMMPKATEEELNGLMAEVGSLSNTVENVSVIHGWGWPIYSEEIRSVGSDQKIKVEIRTIEIL